MDSNIRLHDIIARMPGALPEPLERSIREADIPVPEHSERTTQAILDIVRKFSNLPPEIDSLSPREKRRLFSVARKDKVIDPSHFPGILPKDRAYIISRLNVAGARIASWEHDGELLTLVEEARKETGFSYRIEPVFILNSDWPQGAANGKCQLFLTEDILRLLPRLPLKALIGHEIHHMEESLETSQAIIDGRISFHEAMSLSDAFEKEHRADVRGAQTEGGVEALTQSLLLTDARKTEIKNFKDASLAAVRRGLREMAPLRYSYSAAWDNEVNDYESMKPVFLRNLLKKPEENEDFIHPPLNIRINHVQNVPGKGGRTT